MLLERLHRHWSQDAEKSSWNWDGSLLPTLQLCLQLSTARQAADTSAARLTGQDTVPSGAVMHVSSRGACALGSVCRPAPLAGIHADYHHLGQTPLAGEVMGPRGEVAAVFLLFSANDVSISP